MITKTGWSRQRVERMIYPDVLELVEFWHRQATGALGSQRAEEPVFSNLTANEMRSLAAQFGG